MYRNETAREQVKIMWEQNPKFSRNRAAKELGVNERTIYNWIRELEGSPKRLKTERKTECSNLRTVSVNNLIDNERLDIKKIIREGIARIPSGEVAYDDNFRRDLQVAEPRWREYSREEEFDNFRATLPNRKVVWGNKITIGKIKQMDGVQ